MMIVDMSIMLDGRAFYRTATWAMVPRVGERVDLTADGWSEPVFDIRWGRSGIPRLDFGCKRDVHDEGLAEALEAEGWR